MQYWEETEHAREIRARAHCLMDERGIAPTPINYELWFSYEHGQDRDLRRALDAAVENGTAGDAVRAKEIHTRFFVRFDDRMEQAGATIRKELVELTSTLTAVGESAAAYGKALDATETELTLVNSTSGLKQIIDKMAQATAQMEGRNKALEAQVNTSSRELNALRARMDAVRQESRIDGLTELANRRAFDEGIESAIKDASEEHKPLCVLMCDIDRFKAFNDTWGHATGDHVLRMVGSLVKKNVKGKDLAARYGGEELVVILPQTALSNAVVVAEQIRTSIESKKIVKKSTGETLGQVTISIGVAQYLSGESSEKLIERADAHLYGAKRDGRNRVSWIPASNAIGNEPTPHVGVLPAQGPTKGISRSSKPVLELEFEDQDTPLIVDAEVALVDPRLVRLFEWWKAAHPKLGLPVWREEYLQQIEFVRNYAHLHELDEAADQLCVRFVGPALIQALGEDPTGLRYSAIQTPSRNLLSTAARTYELVRLTRFMKGPLRAYSKGVRHLQGGQFTSEMLFLPFAGKYSDITTFLGATIYTPAANAVAA